MDTTLLTHRSVDGALDVIISKSAQGSISVKCGGTSESGGGSGSQSSNEGRVFEIHGSRLISQRWSESNVMVVAGYLTTAIERQRVRILYKTQQRSAVG